MFDFLKKKKMDLSTVKPIISQKYQIEFKCRQTSNGYDYCTSVQWNGEKKYFYLELDSKKNFSINQTLAYFEAMFEKFSWWEENVKQKFLADVFRDKDIADIPNWSEWNSENEESWHIKMTRNEFYNLIHIDEIEINKNGKIQFSIRIEGDNELVSPDSMWVSTEITGTKFNVHIQ